jgi:hypothetical protein
LFRVQESQKMSPMHKYELHRSEYSRAKVSWEQGCQMLYFQNRKYTLEGLGIDNVGIFCGHSQYFNNYLVCFLAIWSFGEFSPVFWYVVPRQIWQPWLRVGYFRGKKKLL